MRTRHVLGTKPRAAPRRLTRARRRLRLASIALPLVLLAPGVYYIAMPSAPPADEIETVIRGAGFDPLVPPNRLRGPGALYVVEGGGRYAKVCDAEPHVLETKVRKSPTPSQVHDRLESGGFSLSGALLDSINASLGATRVSSIEYTLADPAISEISLSDLSEIEDAMLQQKRCDDTVQRLLKQGKKVCSGAAALSATTRYRVHVEAKFEANAEDRTPILSAAQKALAEHTQSQIQSIGTDQFSGEDLFYGIQLSELCITLDTATEPSVLTNSDVPQPPASRPGI
jgi:hypothetical protein